MYPVLLYSKQNLQEKWVCYAVYIIIKGSNELFQCVYMLENLAKMTDTVYFSVMLFVVNCVL